MNKELKQAALKWSREEKGVGPCLIPNEGAKAPICHEREMLCECDLSHAFIAGADHQAAISRAKGFDEGFSKAIEMLEGETVPSYWRQTGTGSDAAFWLQENRP